MLPETKYSRLKWIRISPYPGGVSGQFNGLEVKIGSEEFLEKERWNIREDIPNLEWTPGILDSNVYLGVNDRIAGVLVFGDSLRADAVSTLEKLKNAGYNLLMVSGDGEGITRKVGENHRH